jgi:hypothetical protein
MNERLRLWRVPNGGGMRARSTIYRWCHNEPAGTTIPVVPRYRPVPR